MPVPCKCSICARIVWMLLMIFFWWPTSVIPKLITSLKKTSACLLDMLQRIENGLSVHQLSIKFSVYFRLTDTNGILEYGNPTPKIIWRPIWTVSFETGLTRLSFNSPYCCFLTNLKFYIKIVSTLKCYYRFKR